MQVVIRAAALALLLSLVDDRSMRLLDDWIAAVDEHTAGEHDAALARIAAWREDDLETMLDYVQALAGLRTNTSDRARRREHLTSRGELGAIVKLSEHLKSRGGFDRFLTRAVLLHTDLAMFGSARVTAAPRPPGARRLPNQPTRRIDVLSQDGQVLQYQLANPHWQYARDLLDALPRTPQRNPVVAQWYRAIGSHFMLQRSFAEAIDHFEAARGTVPDDPDVLYGAACLEELFGAPRIQDYVRVATQQGVIIRSVSSPQSHFKRAAEMLRKALAARPDFSEARLRLGRLLVEQENYDEALTHLQQVTASAKDSTLIYYAEIFSGDAALGLGRPAAARTAYERALDQYPSAQAAHLGLAAALRLLGERQAAVDAVMSTVTLPSKARDEDDEPWWSYYEGTPAEVDRLLASLRAPYRERAK